MTQELQDKARAGDAGAFSALAEPLRPRLLAYLYRRLADRGEAEDLCQETLLEAYTSIAALPTDFDFKAWIFQLAFRLADRVAEGERPWGESALDVLQDYMLEHEAVQGELQEIFESREEEYSIEDHADFCFTVALHGLFPKERTLFLLTEVEGFSSEEAARITGMNSVEVEEKREDAVENLQESFATRCSLVKAGASCKQCQVFGEWLRGGEETEEELHDLPLRPSTQAEATFPKRVQLIRRIDPLRSGSPYFHEALLQLLRRALGEKGLVKP